MKSYSIVIVERETTVRAHLRNAFFGDPHVFGVHVFASTSELLPVPGHTPPDVIMLGSTSADGTLRDAITSLKEYWPNAPVVVVTRAKDAAFVVEAVSAGANGCVTADTSIAELVRQAHAAIEGGAAFTGATAQILSSVVRDQLRSTFTRPENPGLTGRERDVLRLLACGSSYKEVASQLEISIDTIRTHVRSLYKKMKVHSATGAVTKAFREGLV